VLEYNTCDNQKRHLASEDANFMVGQVISPNGGQII